jgi:hypothetical protein
MSIRIRSHQQMANKLPAALHRDTISLPRHVLKFTALVETRHS